MLEEAVSIEVTTTQPLASMAIEPVPPTPPTDLVFDDGVPLESPRHRVAMNLLIRSAHQALRDRSDFYVGGNMFVYYSRTQAMNRDFRGPDFFVALDVDGKRDRKAWITWEEEGQYPDMIVELLSESTETVDRGQKKRLYERVFKTPDYFVFDPFDPQSLQGWRLHLGQGYQPLQPNEQGWLWCETLQLWLGLWSGVVDREPSEGSCAWLRFFDAAGHLVLLPEEKGEQMMERLRARGIDPDELLSE
ncbi:Uma2 family endonuclease [Microcoleus sp. FACHB-1515]|nr:Uma2 family endonuclease [Microcoleus sp. FACHB-1515]